MMIAALFVERYGTYWDHPGIDPWDERRDARRYPGPHPVIAHPPCARWGRYARGMPGNQRFSVGDDGGCFESALASAHKWGGVIEHPRDSKAWKHYGYLTPPHDGGWVSAGWLGGWTCCTDQGNYGHRARKATWLLYFGPLPHPLKWGDSGKQVLVESMGEKERAATPDAFKSQLYRLALKSRGIA